MLGRFERGSFQFLPEYLHDLEYSRSRPSPLVVAGQINTQPSSLLLSCCLFSRVMGHSNKGRSCPFTTLWKEKEKKKGKRKHQEGTGCPLKTLAWEGVVFDIS